MKLRKFLSVLLTLATVMSMFAICSVSASARATAYVKLDVEPRGAGQVRFNNGEWGTYIGQSFRIEEETIQIEAKAAAGYKFVKWGSPVNSSKNPVKLTGLSNKETYYIEAFFEKIPEPEYAITVKSGTAQDFNGGWKTVSQAVAGRKIYLTADPAPQSEMVFDKWVVNSGSVTLANASETTTTFTMPATAVSIEATYKQSDPNAGKKISLYFIQGDKYGQGEYELQATYGQTFEFPPDPFGKVNGYEFIGWHDVDTRKEYKPGDKGVATETTYYAADYKGLPVKVSFDIFDKNTATGTMKSFTVNRGESFTLPECTFTPKKGYIFGEYMLFGKPGDTAAVNSDTVIYAKFEEDPDYSPFCVITFDNGYTGSKHDTYTAKTKKNSTYTLPTCSFLKAEKDKKFKCWDMGEVGKTIEIGSENELTITAVWAIAGDLSDCTVTVNYGDKYRDTETYSNYLYRNAEITPIYEVKTKSGYVLKEGEDYTAEYSNNVGASEKAKIKLTGKGNFTGTKKVNFTISPLPVYEILCKTGTLDEYYKVEFNLGAALPNGETEWKTYPLTNNVYFAYRKLARPDIINFFDFEYTGKPISIKISPICTYKGEEYLLKESDFEFVSTQTEESAPYPGTKEYKLYASGKNTLGKSETDKFIEYFGWRIVVNNCPTPEKITKVNDNKYKVKYTKKVKNENCYVQVKVTEYDEKGNKLGTKKYTVKDPSVNSKKFNLKYWKTASTGVASIGVRLRYVVYYDHGYKDKNDKRNYTYGSWSYEKKYQIKDVADTVNISKT